MAGRDSSPLTILCRDKAVDDGGIETSEDEIELDWRDRSPGCSHLGQQLNIGSRGISNSFLNSSTLFQVLTSQKVKGCSTWSHCPHCPSIYAPLTCSINIYIVSWHYITGSAANLKSSQVPDLSYFEASALLSEVESSKRC